MQVVMISLPFGVSGASEETPDRTHHLDCIMDIMDNVVPFKTLEETASLEKKISDLSCVSSLILLNY